MTKGNAIMAPTKNHSASAVRCRFKISFPASTAFQQLDPPLGKLTPCCVFENRKVKEGEKQRKRDVEKPLEPARNHPQENLFASDNRWNNPFRGGISQVTN